MAHTEPSAAPIDRLAYSVQEAVFLLGLSRTHINRLIASGELGSIKAGSRRLIPHAAVLAFLDVE